MPTLPEGDSPRVLSARSRAWARGLIWTICFAALCAVTFPFIKRMLPTELHRTWTTTVQVAPGVSVQIEAHRHGGREYSSKLAIDAMEIRLISEVSKTSSGAAVVAPAPIRIGPNPYIARYDNSARREVRGASPPDEIYIQGWLKQVGVSESAAKPIQDVAAQAYHSDLLDRNELGSGWISTQTPYIRRLTSAICFIVMFVIWLAGVWYTLIPTDKR